MLLLRARPLKSASPSPAATTSAYYGYDDATTTRLFSTTAAAASSSVENGTAAGTDDDDRNNGGDDSSSRRRSTSRAAKRALAAVRAESGSWRTIDWGAVDLLGSCSSSSSAKVFKDDDDGDSNSASDDSEYGVSTIDSLLPTLSPAHPSPVELVVVRDRMVYVKRDDLLRLPKSNVSGNKARKVLALNQIPAEDFPECVVSYGGPQSNSMLSLAAAVNAKNAELDDMAGMGTKEGDDEVKWGSTIEGFMGDDVPGGMSPEEAAAMLEEKHDSEENEKGASSDDDDETDESLDGAVRAAAAAAPDNSRDDKPSRRRFVYYTKKLPRYLRRQPSGNLLRALSLGMELIELSPPDYTALFGGQHGGSSLPPSGLQPPVRGDSVWIPQGGACGGAVPGVKLLAEEIVKFWDRQQRGRIFRSPSGGSGGKGEDGEGNLGAPLSVCIPGGTCATGYLLHREMERMAEDRRASNAEKRERGEGEPLPELDIRVVVIPCVGDDAYAKRQMAALAAATGDRGPNPSLPAVLRPLPGSNYGVARRRNGGYFTFGEPAAALMQTFHEMRDEHGVFVDLLYGAPAWSLLLQHWKATAEGGVGSGHFGREYTVAEGERHPIAGRQVMYVHTGGLEGIASQMTRYRHKGLVDSNAVQN